MEWASHCGFDLRFPFFLFCDFSALVKFVSFVICGH